MKKIFALIFIFPLFISIAEARSVMYERCVYSTRDITNKMIASSLSGDTKSEACEDCLIKTVSSDKNYHTFKDIISKALYKPTTIHPICFYASALRSNQKKEGKTNYYHCSEGSNPKGNNSRTFKIYSPVKNKELHLYPRRACLSKDYIDMTANSFNYMASCLGFSSKTDKRQLFALYNHESQFILNNRSSTGARCYGQLTSALINTIDKSVFKYKLSENIYAQIFNEAVNKCPDLNQKVIYDKTCRKNIKTTHKCNTCRVTQDPHTCFFYSMMYIRKNKKTLRKILLSNDRPMPKNAKISDEIKKQFQMPIKRNEIVYMKGTVKTKSGKTKEVDLILKDDHEAYDTLNGIDLKNSSVKVKKVNLYKPDSDLEWYILHSAYNGGDSVIYIHLQTFLSQVKGAISSNKTCINNPKGKFCSYRQNIQNDKPLEYVDMKEDFKRYLLTNYRKKTAKKKRKQEVANFYKKIQEEMGYVTYNQGETKRYKTPSDHLIKMQTRNNKYAQYEPNFIKEYPENMIFVSAIILEQEVKENCSDLVD